MHRMIDKCNLMKMGNVLMNMKAVLRKYAGQIGYYACVALVLAAVALAAERFRNGDEAAQALVLPAVELAEPVPEEKEALFEVPDPMEVMGVYSSQPEWNSIHRQWETHAAVDFVSEDERVYSFSEGVVRTVGKSGLYGGFVEVETEDYLLRYCSVEPEEGIIPGKLVKKGVEIGSTDNSMPGEGYMGSHLHFELWKNDNACNIMEECRKNF